VRSPSPLCVSQTDDAESIRARHCALDVHQVNVGRARRAGSVQERSRA
jgi:hypothetical protein